MNKNTLSSAAPASGTRSLNLHAASWSRCLATIASLLVVSLSLCHAVQSVTLAWNASSDSTTAGYKLRYGTTSGNPSQSVDVGTATSRTVSNLDDATTYYFTVVAYNTAGAESLPSNEISYTTPGPGAAGPTISVGERNILTSADSDNGNLLVAQQANLAQSATIQSLSFYVTNASGRLRLGIFDATGPNGGPGAKKAETAEITPTAGWNIANVITPVSLPAGSYWLAYLPSDNDLAFVKDLSGQARFYTYSYGQMPATFSTSPQSETVHWSLFATLRTSAPTLALTVVNGSGDGNYPYGTLVPVSADAPQAGQQFDSWTGDTAILPAQDLNKASTTALIPSMDVTITATYAPIPTISIGETNILASDDSGNGNLLVAQQANLAQSATIQSLSFYVTNASGRLRLGIFDATGPNGGPGARKAETAEITPTAGWNRANVITPVSLPAGSYWLAYLPSDNGLAFVKDLSAQARFYTYTYGRMPATFSTSPESETVHWSLFATLTTSD